MNGFMHRPQARKGAIGEQIIDEMIAKKGWVPYGPRTDQRHPFDRLVAAPDGSQIMIADVKSKARRTYYPDTGINIRHYHKYKAVSQRHNLRVFLFFVDEMEGKIYGNFLHVLDRATIINHRGTMIEYPLENGGIRYWPITAMQELRWLTPEEILALKEFNTRNPIYDGRAA